MKRIICWLGFHKWISVAYSITLGKPTRLDKCIWCEKTREKECSDLEAGQGSSL